MSEDSEDPEKDKRIRRIKSIFEGAKPARRKSTPKSKPEEKPKPNVSGIGNVVGDGNSVTNNMSFFPQPPIRKVVVKTGDGVLDAAQKAALKKIVDEIVDLEKLLRRSPRSFGAVWGALNRSLKVNSYAEIPAEAFPLAERRLQQEAARLRAMKTAVKKVPDQAAKRRGAIHARAKEFPDGDQRRRAYMMKKFGVSSMTELGPLQLEMLYRHVMGWKRG